MQRSGAGNGESRFPHLFSPGRIGSLTIPNRFVRSATAEEPAVYLESRIPETTIDLYRRLARSGIGVLVFAGPVSTPRDLAADRFESWKQDYAACRREGADRVPPAVRAVRPEARILGQLEMHPQERPSAIPLVLEPGMAREMTPAQIGRMIESFAIAISRTKDEGYDGAQLHAGHGTILGRFISPYSNRRHDRYGKGFQGRMRVVREIVDRAREEVGEFPILIKANATDHIEGGIDGSLFPRIAEELQRIGYDAIEVTGGMWDCLARSEDELGFRPIPAPESRTGIVGDISKQSYFLPFVQDVDVDIPLILTGGNRNVERLEAIVAEGLIDFVGMCRPLIREPELVDRWRRGVGGAEATCLACNSCIYLLNESAAAGRPYRPDVCPPRDEPAIHAKAQRFLSTCVSDWLSERDAAEAEEPK